MNIENMNLREAIEILEEVMELDDSIYAYNRKYYMALEFVLDCIKRDMAESEETIHSCDNCLFKINNPDIILPCMDCDLSLNPPSKWC